MIALSLNASAMYFGFAVGGALGGLVLTTLTPSDLGWVGGCSEAVALALVLIGSGAALQQRVYCARPFSKPVCIEIAG